MEYSIFFEKKLKKPVDLYKKSRRKTLNMAKTISKLANSLTKNVFSYKIALDTKKHENAKGGNELGERNWRQKD